MSRWLLGLFFVFGCGSRAPDTEPATHDDFRAIQRYEATMGAALTTVGDETVSCERVCAAADEGCAASQRICAIAEGTADLDAITRCDRGRDECRETRASSSRCDCGSR